MRRILLLMVIAMFVFSCKKNDTQNNPAQPPTPAPNVTYSISDYFKLTTGNYWVYSEYIVDTLNNATPAGTDSCFVNRDTLIHGDTFAIVNNFPPGGPQYFRDSSSFLVNQNGRIYFTTTDFNVTLATDTSPSLFRANYDVPSTQSMVTVPAGSYNCYYLLGTLTFISGYPEHMRYTYNYYAANIGMVELITFYVSDYYQTLQYRLVRYHVL